MIKNDKYNESVWDFSLSISQFMDWINNLNCILKCVVFNYFKALMKLWTVFILKCNAFNFLHLIRNGKYIGCVWDWFWKGLKWIIFILECIVFNFSHLDIIVGILKFRQNGRYIQILWDFLWKMIWGPSPPWTSIFSSATCSSFLLLQLKCSHLPH